MQHISLSASFFLKDKGCDVAICATRSKWGSVEELKNFAAEEGAEIEGIAKSYEYSLCDTTQRQCIKRQQNCC